jgi:uncharacterized protein affecting Mg2+/Co2+ transport
MGLFLLATVVAACGQPPEPAPAVDAGVDVDAGADAGQPFDAGQKIVDAGSAFDAGFVDAGVPPFNGSQFVSQSIPASVAAGATFTVSVTMKNTGTTTWALGATGHFLGSEGPRDNMVWGTNRVFMKAGESVAPGSSYTFTGSVTAPTAPGSYPMQWQMLQNAVEWFGALTPPLSVVVMQTGAPANATPGEIVAFHRNKYGTPMSPADTVACLRAIAVDLSAHNVAGKPFGILVKTAGSMCNGYSCDIICADQGQAQRQWDVFVDAGGSANPTWNEVAAPVTVRPCEIL